MAVEYVPSAREANETASPWETKNGREKFSYRFFVFSIHVEGARIKVKVFQLLLYWLSSSDSERWKSTTRQGHSQIFHYSHSSRGIFSRINRIDIWLDSINSTKETSVAEQCHRTLQYLNQTIKTLKDSPVFCRANGSTVDYRSRAFVRGVPYEGETRLTEWSRRIQRCIIYCDSRLSVWLLVVLLVHIYVDSTETSFFPLSGSQAHKILSPAEKIRTFAKIKGRRLQRQAILYNKKLALFFFILLFYNSLKL